MTRDEAEKAVSRYESTLHDYWMNGGKYARSENVAEARDALVAALTAPDWRGIKTDPPPMDGTWIDLWGIPWNGAPAGRFVNMSWGEGAWRMPSVMSNGSPGLKVDAMFTHWMPLLAAPKVTP